MYSHKILFETNDKTGTLNVNIETERLYLKSVTNDCIELYKKLTSDPEVMEKYSRGNTWTPEYLADRFATWTKRWNENDPFSALAVYKKDDGQFIGHIILGYATGDNDTELAYIFHKSSWGQGYAKEAALAVVKDYAPMIVEAGYLLFDEEQNKKFSFERVTAGARTDNEASVKILQRTGMQFEKEVILHGAKRSLFFKDAKELVKERQQRLDEAKKSTTEQKGDAENEQVLTPRKR